MNAIAIAQLLAQVLGIAQGIAQTQQAAASENRDVTDAELDAHRQALSQARDQVLADLAAGN